MRKLLIIILFFPACINAQENLTLQKAQQLARANYPLIKQKELLKQSLAFSIENLSKGYLPQFNLSAQATYQSEVTQVKIPVPGFTVEPLNNDQYKILADINQLIYDGGAIKEQKNIQQLNEVVEQEKIEVELYKLTDRINQLYLGVLFIDEQLKQVQLVKADLNIGIKKVEAQVKNGVAFRSNLNVLKAESLKADQRIIELKALRKGLTDVLGIFINQTIPAETRFETPVIESAINKAEIQRPELKLFSNQVKLLESQNQLIDAKNKPKTSLFLQGGYGRPGLNFLNNQFDFFYTTGVRFNWSFSGLYTQKREKKLIEINQQAINIQKEVFLLNTSTQLQQQQAEMDKLQELINTDKEIIDLRISVKEAAKAQLDNGVITANDYLREVNAEDQVRQSLVAHQLQLLQAQINYQTISGKQ